MGQDECERIEMNEAAKQAAWQRCLAWQSKTVQELPIESKTTHDHEFKKIFTHENHDQKKDGARLFKIVNTDPDFLLAQSWGVWPQALFNAAKTYSVPKVKQAVNLVKNYTGVKNKAAYLMAVIKNPSKPL